MGLLALARAWGAVRSSVLNGDAESTLHTPRCGAVPFV